jgi:hypothetical protein
MEPAAAGAENTTRICMKNVPTSFDEKRLEQHILQSAASSSSARQTQIVITDCKILKTKDGKTRKLAFLGFKTPTVRADEILRMIRRCRLCQHACIHV